MITKTLLFSPLLLLIFSVSDLHAQGVGGGGGGFRMAEGGCLEGRQTWFQETRGNREVAVLRTCHNGSYYDLSEYIYNPKPRCSEEGKVEKRKPTSDRDNPSEPYFVYCRKGRWVRLSAVEMASR